MIIWIKFTHSCSFGLLIASAAAAAKSLQSCPTLCDPLDGSLPGFPVPRILQARTLEWVAISFSNAWKWKVKVKSLSRVGPSATPWTAAFQAPPSMGFSRQEYWSGVPLPSLLLIAKMLIFTLAISCFPGPIYLDSFFSTLPTGVLDTYQHGGSSSSAIPFCLFILFTGFSRQETGVVCHSLFQWATFYQLSPPCLVHLGWPCTCMAHSFIELHKAQWSF